MDACIWHYLVAHAPQYQYVWSFGKGGKESNTFQKVTFINIWMYCLLLQISKTNAQYHKIFKEISKDELLKQSKWRSLQFKWKLKSHRVTFSIFLLFLKIRKICIILSLENKPQSCHLCRIDFAWHPLLCLFSGYTCALQKDMLYQGKMFVSDNWICFHSKVFGRDTKVQYNNGIL